MAVSSISVAAAAHLVGVLVHLEVGEGEHAVALVVVAGAAQDGPDAGDELLEAEGLGHVVVAAEREAADLVLGARRGR